MLLIGNQPRLVSERAVEVQLAAAAAQGYTARAKRRLLVRRQSRLLMRFSQGYGALASFVATSLTFLNSISSILANYCSCAGLSTPAPPAPDLTLDCREILGRFSQSIWRRP